MHVQEEGTYVKWFVYFSFIISVSTLNSPCIARRHGYDSVVCVCNSSYCDFAPPPPPLSAHQYVVYTSSMAGLRFQQTSGTFDTPNKVDSKGGKMLMLKKT